MSSAPQVIKVFHLKRFMPETVKKIPKLKGPCNLESIKNDRTKIYSENKRHTEKDIVEEKPAISDIEDTSHCHDNHIPANRSKIKFRYCSHSPEELAMLHEHVDETLVKLGDTFDSRDSLRQHLNDNARKWYYYYVCRSSKIKVLEYTCICMAYNNKKRDVVIRKQKKRTTACPCKLRLTIDEVTNKIIVYYVCNHHDHPTTESAFSQYPHAKYLPQHIKDEFLDLTYAGLDVSLIQKYVFSVIGLRIKMKDICSYAYRFRKNIYQRTFSEKRLRFIEDLIKRIRETFGETSDTDSIDLIEKPTKTVIRSAPNKELDIHPNEDSFYKGLGDYSLGIDKEILVQYINEEGLLCDQNGLVTNGTGMQVIYNMYAVPGIDKQVIDGVLSPEMATSDEVYDLDWESLPNKCLSEGYKNESNIEESDSYFDQRMELEVESSTLERAAKNTVIHSNSAYKNRYSLTPQTPGVYAEIDNFNKYYYSDHRYITYEEQDKEKLSAIRHDEKVRRSAPDLTPDVIREEYIKAPNFTCTLSLRHCTGHDHLDSLDDPDAILAGASFLTVEAFLDYVNKRAQRWYFYYSLAESGKSPENYAYKCVYGKYRVSKNAYRAKGLRRRNNQKTDCPCLIRLRRLDSAPEYLTVLYSCNHHDHPRDERQFNSQVHSRRLPPHMKEEIKDLVTLRVSSDVLRKYVFDATGLMISAKYFYNLWAGMRRRNVERLFTGERSAFLNEKVQELGAKYGDVIVQGKSRKVTKDELEDCFTPAADMDVEEYCELTDFAEEVCIV